LSLDIKLFDDRWSKHRAITSLDWSPKHSDIVVASYSSNETANINDPDGVVLVWSLKDTLQRPEYRFHCQSSVTSCIFSTFSPTLIIGGTYSGQIVLWDIRASPTPIQNTPLSSIGHTHPIFCMTIVGTKNAHNLITISSDGKLCVWAVENLIQPIEVLELYNKQTKTLFTNMPVAVTAMAFPEGEVNKFLIGSEEGAIYLAERHGNINGIYEKLNNHHGPITAIDFHPSHGSIDFSNLFLTSSTDWSCKLWNEKGSRKFIYSFEESNDYIYDIKWCPTHPAIFATADGTGSLDIWNLNQETEVPIIKTNVGGNSKALNKIKWSVDGKKILVGDSIGNLYLYNTGEISIPNQDEWRRFEETLIKLSTVQDDMSSPTNY
jgi:dynein intermediate chain